MAKLNKQDLLEAIKAKGEYASIAETERVLGSVVDAIKDILLNGNSCDIKGFGKFEVVHKAERSGVSLGKEWSKPAHMAPKFSVSPSLVSQVAETVAVTE